MASPSLPQTDSSTATLRNQHGALSSNDPEYLLELMDTIDSDDSDDDFEGYIDLDDPMQATTNLDDDIHNSTHKIDETPEHQQRTQDNNTGLPLTSPSSSLQLSVPYTAVATSPEDALPENSQRIQSTFIQCEMTATPSASNSPQQSSFSLASTDQANSQSSPSATSSSPPK